MERERILDILRKLIEHEQSARTIGSIAEAEAFAARIQQLLFKHKLEMTDIEIEAEADEPILGEFVSLGDMTAGPAGAFMAHQNWISILVTAVAEANGCEVIRQSAPKKGYSFVGRETDRQAAKTLFRYLYMLAIEVGRVDADRHVAKLGMTGRWAATQKNSFMQGWRVGFGSAIYNRLRRVRQELRAGADSQALIRIDQLAEQVTAEFKRLFPRQKIDARSIRLRNRDGYQAGRAYGAGVGLNNNSRLKA